MPEPSAAPPKRILIIDDLPELRELAQGVLEAEGFIVDVAPDASLGGLKLLANKPDLVILDLMMPGVDGFKFLESTKQTVTNRPAVVFLSGNYSGESVLRGVALGAFAFLAKPVNFKTLVETCHAALKGPSAGQRGQAAAERRAHPRRAVLVQVELVPAEAWKGPVLGEMTELSAEGAAVISIAEVFVGARVQVTPDPRVFHLSKPLIGEIRSSTTVATGFRYGIEFVDLDPEMERLLREHLAPAPS